MPGNTSPTPHPNDSCSESHETSKSDLLGKYRTHHDNSFLYPIDESEEFLNPYSDLNLYLSKKIKKELQNYGSPSKWSHQIQDELLSKLLPEFKKRFPKYRLGGTALRTIWDKVSYFYKKVQLQKGLMKADGNLNLDYMIRENLRQSLTLKQCSNLPPYTGSHRLAVRISECIAVFDGIQMDLHQLTQTIWAVHKHLLKNLSPMNAKSPYEEYDQYDKLITKTLLEITSIHPKIEANTLYEEIKRQFVNLSKVAEYGRHHKLTTIISILLAQKHFELTHLNTLFCRQETLALEAFISRQIDLSSHGSPLSLDSLHLDLVQRLLTLYPIASRLPKNYPEGKLIAGIRYVYHLTTKHPFNQCPILPQILYIFIKAEMHHLKEKSSNATLQEVQREILKSYSLSEMLPQLELHEFDQLEMLIWKVLDQKKEVIKEIPPNLLELIEKEIANHIIESQDSSYKPVVSSTLKYFRRIQHLSLNGQKVNQKIQVLSIQNDMLCRWIHCNHKTPLLQLIADKWKRSGSKEATVNHDQFVNKIMNEYLRDHPLLKNYKSQLRTRIWILYKHFWYNPLNKHSESSYERFIKWHMTKNKSKKSLDELSRKILPLTPLQEK